jgi:protein-S-isoprenylcysteine O-methyltransferase Ste14
MQTSSTPDSPQKVTLNKYGYNTMARHWTMVIITAAPLFLVGGTWSWDWAWIYSAASLIGWTALNIILAVENPGLLNERGRPRKEITVDAKSWDMAILLIYTILLFVLPIVAGLDFRYGWSAPTSPIIHILGIVLLLLGFVPLTWAMAANKFFAPTVQIQAQGGHQVADSGPYRYVRHPGYVGVILHFIAVPLALGTWTALIPALIGTALFVVRTALEDKTLRDELPGYADFAKRTRYRLLPGIW